MSKKGHIADKLRNRIQGPVLKNEPLSKHTSYRIGGPADAYAFVMDEQDIRTIITTCRAEGIVWCVIGKGSNLLVSDNRFRGVVIDLSDGFTAIRSSASRVSAEAGVALWDLVRYCTDFGLAGMERLAGIPGDVGGAIILNAGAFEQEIFDTVHAVHFVDAEGKAQKRLREVIYAGYRRTDLPRNLVITRVEFEMESDDPLHLKTEQERILQRRRLKQPLSLPSAGSVFKRPQGDYAGRLIEAVGLKGLRIGDAMISKKHANFIVNVGQATAFDVLRLIREARRRVNEEFGILLEPEIHFLGFDEEVP